MPRTKYVITEQDLLHAELYLSARIRNYEIDFRDDVDCLNAEAEYREATAGREKTSRAGQLNAWCEKYLTTADWARLKSAIRKRRERLERDDEQKTVTVSAESHRLLFRLAARDDVTYSEVLEHYLAKALNSNRGRPNRSRRPR